MTDEINWTLIQHLTSKPHKHLNIVAGAEYFVEIDGVRHASYDGEVMQEARAVQHLCDMAGIPEGHGDDAHIDARVYRLLTQTLHLRHQLERIATWHSRVSGPHGMVGDLCVECGLTWPCDTRRMADGTYKDEE